MTRRNIPLVFACALFSAATLLLGAEHAAAPADPAAQAKAAIERYVEHDVAIKKAFLLLDPRSGEVLRLTFDHVHPGVESKGAQQVACVDFHDAAGKVYDVDAVVDAAGEVTAVYLHKVDGKPVPQE
jgi:hypothetical protein